MAGEQLDHVEAGPLGLEGDRVLHVRDVRGRIITARTHPRLLGHRAVFNQGLDQNLDQNDGPRVDGHAWTDAAVRASVEAIAGPGARLVRDGSAVRFDILPLLVATDGAIAAFGYDRRRLRPNLVIGGVHGLDEREWEGRSLRVGDVVIALADLRGRCVMTTFDPDTLAQDPRVLSSILRRFGGRLALNAAVAKGGTIRVGATVELLASSGSAASTTAVG